MAVRPLLGRHLLRNRLSTAKPGWNFHIRLVRLPLGLPFSQKIPEQGLKFCKNSKIGISKAYNFQEQVKFILKALLVVKSSDFVH